MTMKTIQEIIDYMQSTPDDSWGVDVVRSSDGKNCFFGHLFNMGVDENESNFIWSVFEEVWATTYMIYQVNDGTDPRYQQPPAKQRVIQYLKDLRDGKEKNTRQLMEDYESVPDLKEKHVK
jgi:hypothetical protein